VTADQKRAGFRDEFLEKNTSTEQLGHSSPGSKGSTRATYNYCGVGNTAKKPVMQKHVSVQGRTTDSEEG